MSKTVVTEVDGDATRSNDVSGSIAALVFMVGEWCCWTEELRVRN